MRYRLGEFAVGPPHDWRSSSRRVVRHGIPGSETTVIWTSPEPAEPAPDLLEALPRGAADRGWLEALRDVIRAHGGGTPSLLLACCDHDADDAVGGGTLSIAAVHPRLSAPVRFNDVVQAGFVIGSPRVGEVSIAPRLFRVRCTNGAITDHGTGAEERCDPLLVGKAAEACLSGAFFEGEMALLRQAAEVTVEHPESLLQQARTLSQWSEVREEHELAADPSAWGLINAVTATARSAPTWAERLRREGDVADILALLARRPRPDLRALEHQRALERLRRGGGSQRGTPERGMPERVHA